MMFGMTFLFTYPQKAIHKDYQVINGGKTGLMMSFVWTGMLLASVVCALLTGQESALASAALEGAQKAVTVGLSIAGPLCLWSGFGALMQKTRLSAALTRLLRPVLSRLFPQSFSDAETAESISANVTANLLGLGNAATPVGIAAVKRMKRQSKTETATDEMCRFIVLNTASIQLLPTTVASLRAAAGAMRPFDILPAVWLTSVCSVAAGLGAARLFRGRKK